ncbi:MAG: hypothetical protein Alpg2KO_06060 [Alphaproteobacteria bacterium]
MGVMHKLFAIIWISHLSSGGVSDDYVGDRYYKADVYDEGRGYSLRKVLHDVRNYTVLGSRYVTLEWHQVDHSDRRDNFVNDDAQNSNGMYNFSWVDASSPNTKTSPVPTKAIRKCLTEKDVEHVYKFYNTSGFVMSGCYHLTSVLLNKLHLPHLDHILTGQTQLKVVWVSTSTAKTGEILQAMHNHNINPIELKLHNSVSSLPGFNQIPVEIGYFKNLRRVIVHSWEGDVFPDLYSFNLPIEEVVLLSAKKLSIPEDVMRMPKLTSLTVHAPVNEAPNWVHMNPFFYSKRMSEWYGVPEDLCDPNYRIDFKGGLAMVACGMINKYK